MKHTFKKSERLSSKKIIDQLFDKKGSETLLSAFHYPFRVFYIQNIFSENTISETNLILEANLLDKKDETKQVQILISVSKRLFKKAVDRNLIKRRTREAYRLNKNVNVEKETKDSKLKHKIAYIGFVYIGKKIETFQKIEKTMVLLLNKIYQ